MVIGSNTTPHFLPIWIANDAGLFQAHGVAVDLKFVSGGQVLMASLISGQAPVVAVGGAMKREKQDKPYVAAEQFAIAKDALAAKNEKLRDFDVKAIMDSSLLKSAVDRGLAGRT
jgi:ABC-type nitrate/sulfonate/bicarbonate transport system substrate-binding protein